MGAERREYLVLLAFCVLAIIAAFVYLNTTAQHPLSSYYSEGQITLYNTSCASCTGTNESVWLAFTQQQQATGMMYRQDFGGAQGMLFVYSSEQQLCFWMANTQIPLKQVWINSSGYVTAVYNARPYNTSPVCSQGTDVLEVPPNSSIGLGYRVSR